MRGLVLAGTASGVGKTVATLATIRAFENAGRTVRPAKAGPDFIDPSHHARVAGRPSRTLDPWLQGNDGLRRNYARGDGDVCVVEGMMGLYDGSAASTAEVAAALDLPVVLVVDASAGMESVAATALGFATYADRTDHDLDVAGVVAQRAHGGRHESGIREALPNSLAYCGRIPPREDLEIPDRHLGLQMGEEAPLDSAALDAAAETLRTDRLLDVAGEPTLPATGPEARLAGGGSRANPGDGDDRPRVAVADDAAFRFVYPATRERLGERATVVPFAPAAGDDLPPCDGVYLPGGYPELHAAALADGPALASVADAAAEGTPVLGECGGLMALAETLTTADGDSHEMAGVLPASVERRERYQALDHVELRARRGALTAAAGDRLRGHEFHYSAAEVAPDARFAFDVERGTGIDGDREGLTEHRTLGTYCHVHPESGAFDAFLDEVTG
ncbi:cobyrinic acid a,c-diamide synthase [Halorubrum sp. C191]|uniref:cobyrinic acid a,c-diamide synthase n=1 Tax=unclassified Halorubrum TaxID=2642239 RepID=UPI000C073B24|nr:MULTISPECIES: cobyrinic acid a,c-diamide synthase [unclassified Halorubrum]PHQ42944.1 cobyrinic acid a,c-diamide synthase [Halorubrum sp. C191]TKX36535.1 cobyrinic acid a,c-diamide synthase [Halorubrum sp. CGM5_25_10-8B]